MKPVTILFNRSNKQPVGCIFESDVTVAIVQKHRYLAADAPLITPGMVQVMYNQKKYIVKIAQNGDIMSCSLIQESPTIEQIFDIISEGPGKSRIDLEIWAPSIDNAIERAKAIYDNITTMKLYKLYNTGTIDVNDMPSIKP